MNGTGVTRPLGGRFLVGALASLLVVGCSEITPAPNEEDVGELESPTHEADALREVDERQDREMEGRAK